MPAQNTIILRDPSAPARPRHLAYREWGNPENTKVVICVHGLSRNSRDFDALASALANNYRVICPDMAGRGNSSWLTRPADYNYATYVTDITALLERLQLKNIVWIGTSMGGIIGMMVAASQPERIARMILNDVGSVVSGKGLSRILNYVGSSGEFANAADAMTYLKRIIASFGIASDAEWQQMFDASFMPLPDGHYALAYDPAISQPFKEGVSKAGIIEDVDLTAIWNAVRCPVLILRGEESDILTQATAASMCSRDTPTRLIEIPSTGHAPALLNHSQIQSIIDWLDIIP